MTRRLQLIFNCTGHNCVWYNQLPSWVSSGNFNAATLTSIIQTHCSTLLTHYKGQAYAWDVVNGAIALIILRLSA